MLILINWKVGKEVSKGHKCKKLKETLGFFSSFLCEYAKNSKLEQSGKKTVHIAK